MWVPLLKEQLKINNKNKSKQMSSLRIVSAFFVFQTNYSVFHVSINSQQAVSANSIQKTAEPVNNFFICATFWADRLFFRCKSLQKTINYDLNEYCRKGFTGNFKKKSSQNI
jgi:hypothetical protein